MEKKAAITQIRLTNENAGSNLECWHPIRAPSGVLAAPLEIQLPGNSLIKWQRTARVLGPQDSCTKCRGSKLPISDRFISGHLGE